MTIPSASVLASPAFREAIFNALLDNATLTHFPTIRDLLPKPPKFRRAREVSARRAATLRKRGEYCHFVRWTANGKCRYAWSGPTPKTFTVRLGPWQSSRYQPVEAAYRIETRYLI